MANNTFKNEGQTGSVKQDKLSIFLESSGVFELDDEACVVVNGGGAGTIDPDDPGTYILGLSVRFGDARHVGASYFQTILKL